MITGAKKIRRNVYGRLGNLFIQYNFGMRIISDVQRDEGCLAEFVTLAKTFLVNQCVLWPH